MNFEPCSLHLKHIGIFSTSPRQSNGYFLFSSSRPLIPPSQLSAHAFIRPRISHKRARSSKAPMASKFPVPGKTSAARELLSVFPTHHSSFHRAPPKTVWGRFSRTLRLVHWQSSWSFNRSVVSLQKILGVDPYRVSVSFFLLQFLRRPVLAAPFSSFWFAI